MDKRELEIILSAVFLLVFIALFFNSGASSLITGRASITGTATYSLVPSDLIIAINNNDYSTDKNEVALNLHAVDAFECRHKNSEVDYWSSWRTYVEKKLWTLSPGLGIKKVSYQCRNQAGYSNIVSDNIVVVS